MKKFLLSTATAAVITVSTIVPASAAAPNMPKVNVDLIRTTICEWLEDRWGIMLPWCDRQEEPDIPEQPEQPETPEQPEVKPPVQPEPELPSEPEAPTPPAEPGIPEAPSDPEVEVPDYVGVSVLERRVVELVNQERAAYGLPALTLRTDLCDGARMKSRDMATNRYFSHESPTYGSPFDMMRSLGITYATAGENIAMGQSSAEAVVAAWMNSEGHRANILSERYTAIGVGHVANGDYWTQWFVG